MFAVNANKNIEDLSSRNHLQQDTLSADADSAELIKEVETSYEPIRCKTAASFSRPNKPTT